MEPQPQSSPPSPSTVDASLPFWMDSNTALLMNGSKGGSFGAVESVKATSDVNSPISGEVVEVNMKLAQAPGLINSSPYGDGWMITVWPSSPAELEALLGPGDYARFCEEEDDHH
ncbi:hypothetical protein KSP40_PGU010482 [Platanthera guangdongensis]|uniref:Glycine cleavage system H protein n=1 Tax=Platanthera guangdongensis TaxID=2320717 RepID=A0ABR2LGB1_9ASPA